ncbi:helix-turn-helix domain-containing protein [Companilactobacillus allii]|uniref:Transcriptional regulator n=1 Tax=Companilactobacillus allii TaxID=1847728 RepID=A0A1P8PZT6_9LACO|nr:helix-turn-helix domain-containing protein [Companilactobacillus allii]APX71133.1 transcriptional regulator [Companilactobacillus allii]USQ68214.1 helix-turn-helix domain-containing protein [Companilactobacillus allii]
MLGKISKLIRERRKSLNLTIEQLAEISGVSESFISRIERGEVDNVRIKKLNDIAIALNMQLSDFFIDQKLSDIYTLDLIKYLSSLSDDERKRVSEVLLKVINL